MEIPRALWRKIQAEEAYACSSVYFQKNATDTWDSSKFYREMVPGSPFIPCEGIGPSSSHPVKGEKVAKRGSQPLWVRVVRTEKEPGGRKPGLRLA